MQEVTTLTSKGQKVFVGMDTHKKSWAVSIFLEECYYKTFSQPPEPKILYHYLQKNFPGYEYYAVYEASYCGYWICRELRSLGVDCIVTHPADIATTDKERSRKTDPRDAKKLARELRNQTLGCVNIPDEIREEDRQLVRQGKTISKDLTRVKNRIKSYLAFKGITPPEYLKEKNWSKVFINWLSDLACDHTVLATYLDQLKFFKDQQLKVNRKIHKLSKEERYQSNVKLISSIKGIGPKSAITWLTEIGDIYQYQGLDQLCSYIGFVPSTHSSGEKEYHGRREHRGNRILRSMLIECAWIAIRVDINMYEAYNRYKKTMGYNKAIIRIAKKLVSRIRFVLMNQQACH